MTMTYTNNNSSNTTTNNDDDNNRWPIPPPQVHLRRPLSGVLICTVDLRNFIVFFWAETLAH